MPAWERDDNTQPALIGNKALYGNTPILFTTSDKKYGFHWAIVPTESHLDKYLSKLIKVGKWDKIYREDLFIYYVKRN